LTRRYTTHIRGKVDSDARKGQGGPMATSVKEQHDGDHGGHDDDAVGQGVFHVNEREGRVNARGEDLTGSQILGRVGLSADRYELFTVKGGHADEKIGPNQVVRVKPGEHFRATLKGTDYSSPRGACHS